MAAATSGSGAGGANIPPTPAGFVPPAPAVAPAPTAPVLTFSDRYRDFRFDSEQDSYGWLLTNFNPMAPNALTPTELLDSILQEDDGNSWAIAVHWQDPNVPTDPGQIVVVHGIKRYPQQDIWVVPGRGLWFCTNCSPVSDWEHILCGRAYQRGGHVSDLRRRDTDGAIHCQSHVSGCARSWCWSGRN
jgi:hypothetical protein